MTSQLLEFNFDDKDVLSRFNKAYVGVVENVGIMYNIQDIFDIEDYFGIKTTPLGANLCLLKSREAGELEDLVSIGASWLEKWFKEARKWELGVVDDERVTWICVLGLPCHVWVVVFLVHLKTFGAFLHADDNTRSIEDYDTGDGGRG
ncbi:hypothetical protein KIW84_056745 [Lathyrus oleraceus]|uniref:DUF4283 domain-containing protein n=1 Tax=Pisum sativum TaxID=3888 RepID=A0A9D4X0A5_PEA|nr:hypothetical protein KIW84_056745 [Pisum sativum]